MIVPRWLALGVLVSTTHLVTGISRAEDRLLLWGDTHVHSTYSFDSYMLGNVTADPDTAYRFAKGVPVLNPTTKTRVSLEQPLDFLAVSEHAERIGVSRSIGRGDPRVLESPSARSAYELVKQGNFREAFRAFLEVHLSRDPEFMATLDKPDVYMENWADIVDAADRHNEPGRFTALVGWEWSPIPDGANLHRVILTNAGGAAAKSFLPFSWNDSARPEDLWAFLDETQQSTGAQFIAIPHNSNVSNGRMFDVVDSDGKPLTKDYAQTRARWEVLVEVTQTKGTSETHPLLSPNDEFALFEYFPNLITKRQKASITAADYARAALKRGLEVESTLEVNPFKFGMIGSTDIHIGLSSAEERSFLGKTTEDAVPSQKAELIGGMSYSGWDTSASGRAAVWAKENTREAIIEAFQRREAYGTTGPRISLRFFGGFTFAEEDATSKDIASLGYRRGVPMGADLTRAPQGKAPSFLIHAVKDPLEANLDRVQIVKGWLDAAGKSHERVYDVVWSGDRTLGADGKLPPVGNTVDLKSGRYSNEIGAAQLAVVWKDPEFDPSARAFYYVRVLQIPTPRHSLLDALALGIDVEKTAHPATLQERAYSSPIWYTP